MHYIYKSINRRLANQPSEVKDIVKSMKADLRKLGYHSRLKVVEELITYLEEGKAVRPSKLRKLHKALRLNSIHDLNGFIGYDTIKPDLNLLSSLKMEKVYEIVCKGSNLNFLKGLGTLENWPNSYKPLFDVRYHDSIPRILKLNTDLWDKTLKMVISLGRRAGMPYSEEVLPDFNDHIITLFDLNHTLKTNEQYRSLINIFIRQKLIYDLINHPTLTGYLKIINNDYRH